MDPLADPFIPEPFTPPDSAELSKTISDFDSFFSTSRTGLKRDDKKLTASLLEIFELQKEQAKLPVEVAKSSSVGSLKSASVVVDIVMKPDVPLIDSQVNAVRKHKKKAQLKKSADGQEHNK